MSSAVAERFLLVGEALLEHRPEDVLLCVEVDVEGTFREAGLADDLVDRGALVAVASEDAEGGFGQALSRLGAASPPRDGFGSGDHVW